MVQRTDQSRHGILLCCLLRGHRHRSGLFDSDGHPVCVLPDRGLPNGRRCRCLDRLCAKRAGRRAPPRVRADRSVPQDCLQKQERLVYRSGLRAYACLHNGLLFHSPLCAGTWKGNRHHARRIARRYHHGRQLSCLLCWAGSSAEAWKKQAVSYRDHLRGRRGDVCQLVRAARPGSVDNPGTQWVLHGTERSHYPGHDSGNQRDRNQICGKRRRHYWHGGSIVLLPAPACGFLYCGRQLDAEPVH